MPAPSAASGKTQVVTSAPQRRLMSVCDNLERSLIISQAGWLPALERLDAKAALARMLWEDAVAADGLRNRVLELRYPSRVIAPDQHRSVIDLFDAGRHAPSQEAFLLGMARVLLPALGAAYAAYQHLVHQRVTPR